MFCPNCGTELSDAALFCKNCGTKVEKKPVVIVEEKKEDLPELDFVKEAKKEDLPELDFVKEEKKEELPELDFVKEEKKEELPPVPPAPMPGPAGNQNPLFGGSFVPNSAPIPVPPKGSAPIPTPAPMPAPMPSAPMPAPAPMKTAAIPTPAPMPAPAPMPGPAKTPDSASFGAGGMASPDSPLLKNMKKEEPGVSIFAPGELEAAGVKTDLTKSVGSDSLSSTSSVSVKAHAGITGGSVTSDLKAVNAPVSTPATTPVKPPVNNTPAVKMNYVEPKKPVVPIIIATVAALAVGAVAGVFFGKVVASTAEKVNQKSEESVEEVEESVVDSIIEPEEPEIIPPTAKEVLEAKKASLLESEGIRYGNYILEDGFLKSQAGVVSCDIRDYDKDGEEEMLVTSLTVGDGDLSLVKFSMYQANGEDAELLWDMVDPGFTGIGQNNLQYSVYVKETSDTVYLVYEWVRSIGEGKNATEVSGLNVWHIQIDAVANMDCTSSLLVKNYDKTTLSDLQESLTDLGFDKASEMGADLLLQDEDFISLLYITDDKTGCHISSN